MRLVINHLGTQLIPSLCHGCYFGSSEHVDLTAFETLGELLGYIFILDGQNPGQHFYEGDFTAHTLVKIGELHPDGSGSHDDELLRDSLKTHGFL